VSRLEPTVGGHTEVVVLAHVDVGGRVAELGQGLLQGLAHEVFQDFAGHVRAALTARPGQRRAHPAEGDRGPSLRAVPIAARALRAWMGSWGRGAGAHRPGSPR
jgi:hypothetical protein